MVLERILLQNWWLHGWCFSIVWTFLRTIVFPMQTQESCSSASTPLSLAKDTTGTPSMVLPPSTCSMFTSLVPPQHPLGEVICRKWWRPAVFSTPRRCAFRIPRSWSTSRSTCTTSLRPGCTGTDAPVAAAGPENLEDISVWRHHGVSGETGCVSSEHIIIHIYPCYLVPVALWHLTCGIARWTAEPEWIRKYVCVVCWSRYLLGWFMMFMGTQGIASVRTLVYAALCLCWHFHILFPFDLFICLHPICLDVYVACEPWFLAQIWHVSMYVQWPHQHSIFEGQDAGTCQVSVAGKPVFWQHGVRVLKRPGFTKKTYLQSLKCWT